MRILLVSESQSLYDFTNKIVGEEHTLLWHSHSALQQVENADGDVAIMDFSKGMIEKGIFLSIITVKGKLGNSIPVLVIMEEPTIQDIYEVLEIGAFDYLEKKDLPEKYEKKIGELIRWAWYLEKYRKKKK